MSAIPASGPLFHILASDYLFPTREEDGIMQMLLEYPKADPNLRDSDGRTLLLHAVVMGNVRAVKILCVSIRISNSTR